MSSLLLISFQMYHSIFTFTFLIVLSQAHDITTFGPGPKVRKEQKLNSMHMTPDSKHLLSKLPYFYHIIRS